MTMPSPGKRPVVGARHLEEDSWSGPRGSRSTHSFPSQPAFPSEPWPLASDRRTDFRPAETHSSEDWMNFLSIYEADEF